MTIVTMKCYPFSQYSDQSSPTKKSRHKSTNLFPSCILMKSLTGKDQ